MITGGALDGIERALTSHLGPGDTVAVEDPCWANLKDLLAALGMHAHPIPVDEHGPTVDGLRSALNAGVGAVIVTSRAQNPTGASISADRAVELRRVLVGATPLVIEDDHWAELADEPLHPIADAADNWLFLRSTSKPYGPDLRLATACGSDHTVARVVGRMRIGTGWVSTVLQHIVLGLWEDGSTAPTLRRASASYRARGDALLSALQQRDVPATGRMGLNVWVPVVDEIHAITTLRDHGYAANPGHHYRIGTPPAVRLSIGALPLDHVDRLADAVAVAAGQPPRS
ncbi:Transcriptional regulator, GntR family [Stackebrandtia soli]